MPWSQHLSLGTELIWKTAEYGSQPKGQEDLGNSFISMGSSSLSIVPIEIFISYDFGLSKE